jgi:hypothetical protein
MQKNTGGAIIIEQGGGQSKQSGKAAVEINSGGMMFKQQGGGQSKQSDKAKMNENTGYTIIVE